MHERAGGADAPHAARAARAPDPDRGRSRRERRVAFVLRDLVVCDLLRRRGGLYAELGVFSTLGRMRRPDRASRRRTLDMGRFGPHPECVSRVHSALLAFTTLFTTACEGPSARPDASASVGIQDASTDGFVDPGVCQQAVDKYNECQGRAPLYEDRFQGICNDDQAWVASDDHAFRVRLRSWAVKYVRCGDCSCPEAGAWEDYSIGTAASCGQVNAAGNGVTNVTLGYVWNWSARACCRIEGTACVGRDCLWVFDSWAACRDWYAACTLQVGLCDAPSAP